jgi:hypothetical protein
VKAPRGKLERYERRGRSGPRPRKRKIRAMKRGRESLLGEDIVILASGRVQRRDQPDQRVERIVASGGCDLREKLIKRFKEETYRAAVRVGLVVEQGVELDLGVDEGDGHVGDQVRRERRQRVEAGQCFTVWFVSMTSEEFGSSFQETKDLASHLLKRILVVQGHHKSSEQ